MKRNILFIVAGLLSCQIVFGQPSFSEKRLRDKALNEGIAYVQQGEYELAAAAFSLCLDLDSTYASAWLLRGQVFIEWGVLDQAQSALETALFYDPSLGEAYFYKGYILFGEDSTGADRRLFDKAIPNGLPDPWSYYFRALSEIRDGTDVLAMNDFDRAIEFKVDFALAYHERAGIKRRIGDFQGSHFDYQQAIAHNPDFPLAYNNMGSVKILLGDYEGAIEDYTTALESGSSAYYCFE